jgi:hypothetical protein
LAAREPFSLKQKLLIVVTAFFLYLPMLLFIIYYRDSVSPRQFAAIAAVNLVVGVSLLALASEKWIRKMK